MKNDIKEPICDIIDIAHWFLTKESMSHKKLQKLCYYAVAWHYALKNKKLCFHDQFQAWIHGPVNPTLYKEYKNEVYTDIQKRTKKPQYISKQIDQFLEVIWTTYGDWTEFLLEARVHKEKPWLEARKDLDIKTPSKNVIHVNTMKEYYRQSYQEYKGANV